MVRNWLRKRLWRRWTPNTGNVTSDKEVTGARKASVHAQDPRSSAVVFRFKLGQRQIARSANISQSTVHDYLERFRVAGLSWPLPAEMSEAALESALFPADPGKGREPAAGVRCLTLAPARRAAAAQAHHPAVVVGGVPGGAPGRIWLQPLLPSLPAMETAARCGDAPVAPARREVVCRLGGGDDPPLRAGTAAGSPARCLWPCWAPAITPTPKLRENQQLELDRRPHPHV